MELLIANLKEKFPGLQIAGYLSPPFRPLTEEEDLQIINEINETKPDFIWVGLGAPKQERWMAEHHGKVTGVMLGVGAGFDFHAGTVKRAPKWMQESCLEWLFRVLQDPKRLLPRYLDTNISFLYYLWKEKKAKQKKERIARKKEGKYKISMIGHKRIPSREGGVEIVVEELAVRMVRLGNQVDVYNRSGYHVSGKEFDEKRGRIFEGIRLYIIPTPRSKEAERHCIFLFCNCFGNASFGISKESCDSFSCGRTVHHALDSQAVWYSNGGHHSRFRLAAFQMERVCIKMLKLGEKIAVKHADELIVLSQNVQDYFWREYGRKTIYIPNGIQRPKLREAEEIVKKYGLEKEGYILFLARIVPEKGIPYLLKAFKQTDTDKKLVIAGGCSHSLEYMEQIKQMCDADERVIMTGFVQGVLLEELFSNAWLYVLPSDVEGMAVSLLEAMSYGRCCLVSDIPENVEVVGDHAVTFQKGNVQDLHDKLQYLLEHEEVHREISMQSAEYICNKFHWDKVVESTLKLYSK